MQKIPTALKVQQIQWYHHNRLGESVKQRMDNNVGNPIGLNTIQVKLVNGPRKETPLLLFCFQPQGATATLKDICKHRPLFTSMEFLTQKWVNDTSCELQVMLINIKNKSKLVR